MMLYCSSIRVAAFSAALLMDIASATAHDETKYPDLRGQWTAVGGSVNYVPGKPRGLGQEAPLTPEYQAIFEANLEDMAEGGQGTDPTTWCLSPGMPHVTNRYGQMEFVVTPETTHILVFHVFDSRRIFTDGRDWPTDQDPSFLGISTVEGSLAYFGTYSVSGTDLLLHIEGSTFPNWTGSDQKRINLAITGDELKYVQPTPSGGGPAAPVAWKRVK